MLFSCWSLSTACSICSALSFSCALMVAICCSYNLQSLQLLLLRLLWIFSLRLRIVLCNCASLLCNSAICWPKWSECYWFYGMDAGWYQFVWCVALPYDIRVWIVCEMMIIHFWQFWRGESRTVRCRNRCNGWPRRWRMSRSFCRWRHANLHCTCGSVHPWGGSRSTGWCASSPMRTWQSLESLSPSPDWCPFPLSLASATLTLPLSFKFNYNINKNPT